jgi:hypothetical protein
MFNFLKDEHSDRIMSARKHAAETQCIASLPFTIDVPGNQCNPLNHIKSTVLFDGYFICKNIRLVALALVPVRQGAVLFSYQLDIARFNI